MNDFRVTVLVIALAGIVSVECCAQSRDLLVIHDGSGTRQVSDRNDWSTKRNQILFDMQEAMGKLPETSSLPALNTMTLDTLKTERYTRYTIHFRAAKDEVVPAYLYFPVGAKEREKRPAMLVLHGTGDLGKQLVDGKSNLANRAVAKELAERGYVVIAPDYPSMGELKDYDFSEDRYESGTMKAIFNHIRCVDLLQSLPNVDPKRIGVIGHSLGGHNAMFVAAFDTRIKVVVSSCGWTLMDYYDIGQEGSKRYGGRLGPWAQDRYMPLLREKFKLDGSLIPFDFDEVIAAIAPRPFFSNSPINDSNFDVAGVKKGIASAMRVYALLNAEKNLQVRYPEAAHDFPTEIRLDAYRYIDKVLKHKATDLPLE